MFHVHGVSETVVDRRGTLRLRRKQVYLQRGLFKQQITRYVKSALEYFNYGVCSPFNEQDMAENIFGLIRK